MSYIHVSVTGFPTEEKLLESYNKVSQDAVGLNTTDFDATVPILAGIVFTNKFENGGNSFPNDVEVCNLLGFSRKGLSNF